MALREAGKTFAQHRIGAVHELLHGPPSHEALSKTRAPIRAASALFSFHQPQDSLQHFLHQLVELLVPRAITQVRNAQHDLSPALIAGIAWGSIRMRAPVRGHELGLLGRQKVAYLEDALDMRRRNGHAVSGV